MRRAIAIFAFFLALLMAGASLAACGSSEDDSVGPGSGVPGEADLLLVFRAGPAAEPERVTLRCPVTEGPSREACRELGKVPAETFRPVPPNTACTEIYGGPQTLRVTGRIGDDTVDSRFSRVNGCEISRWETLAPVLRSLDIGEVGVALPR